MREGPVFHPPGMHKTRMKSPGTAIPEVQPGYCRIEITTYFSSGTRLCFHGHERQLFSKECFIQQFSPFYERAKTFPA